MIIWGIIGFFIALIGSFAYYHNNINPAILSNVHLENNLGQKVVFVKMSHIATENFYNQKKQSIDNLSNSGFIILEEWVRPGTSESEEKFHQMLGFDLRGDTYEKVSKIFNYTHQTRDLYDNIPENQLVSVDLSLDDIVISAESLNSHENKEKLQNLQIEEVLHVFENLSEFQKATFRYLWQFLLNITAKQAGDSFSFDSIDSSLMNAILDKRNMPVVEYIRSNPDKNIAIVYGSAHYDGIIEELRKFDKTWKIVWVEPFVPYSQD